MPRAGLSELDFAKILSVHGGNARPIGDGQYVVDLPAGASEEAVVAQLAHHPQPHGDGCQIARRGESRG